MTCLDFRTSLYVVSIASMVHHTLGSQIGVPTSKKESRFKKCLSRTSECDCAAPRRVANEHLEDALMLAITSYTARYKKCIKMKPEDQRTAM